MPALTGALIAMMAFAASGGAPVRVGAADHTPGVSSWQYARVERRGAAPRRKHDARPTATTTAMPTSRRRGRGVRPPSPTRTPAASEVRGRRGRKPVATRSPVSASRRVSATPTTAATPARSPGPSRTPAPTPIVSEHDYDTLATRTLVVPVAGIAASELVESFEDRRGGRRHEALDIAAPHGTAVVAIDRGTIAKLFTSAAGGLTIYQFDADGAYVFYYAHLDRYAGDLREGQTVERGAVIGYVGTSGNARATQHLHFAIFKLGPERLWWKGAPLDPFPILRRAAATAPARSSSPAPSVSPAPSSSRSPSVSPAPSSSPSPSASASPSVSATSSMHPSPSVSPTRTRTSSRSVTASASPAARRSPLAARRRLPRPTSRAAKRGS